MRLFLIPVFIAIFGTSVICIHSAYAFHHALPITPIPCANPDLSEDVPCCHHGGASEDSCPGDDTFIGEPTYNLIMT